MNLWSCGLLIGEVLRAAALKQQASESAERPIKHTAVPYAKSSNPVGLEWRPKFVSLTGFPMMLPLLLVCIPHLEDHYLDK